MGSKIKMPGGVLAYAAPQSKQDDITKMPGFVGPPSITETKLSPEQEQQFIKWKAINAPHDSGEDYDLRAAFLANIQKDARGHGPDTFKKPNHPTFSDESKYNGANGERGGKWVEKDGKTYFYASPTNLKYHSVKEVQAYFKKTEPDVILVLPGKK
jgi:hypothetical protein